MRLVTRRLAPVSVQAAAGAGPCAGGAGELGALVRVAGLAALTALAGLVGCGRQGDGRSNAVPPDAAVDSAVAGAVETAATRAEDRRIVLRAENLRRAEDIPPRLFSSRDVATRRVVARALARIGGEASRAGLLRVLGDDDEETVTWAAYGLGFGCALPQRERASASDPRSDDQARAAVVARLASLSSRPSVPSQAAPEGTVAHAPGVHEGAAALDVEPPLEPARIVMARAVARCSGANRADGEATLVGWLRDPELAEGAALGLGDLGSLAPETAAPKTGGSRGGGASAASPALEEVTLGALLDLASGDPSPASRAAFFPLSRVAAVPAGLRPRLLEAVRRLLARTHDDKPRAPARAWRPLALRSLRQAGPEAVLDLVDAVASPSSQPAEASEAARALGALGVAGQEGLAQALVKLAPTADPFASLVLAGDAFGPLTTVVQAFREPVPSSAEVPLQKVTQLRPPGVPAALERRLEALRCQAASLLARGAYDAEVIVACAPPGSVAAERAQLSALLRRPLAGDHKTAFVRLARSTHRAIREAALEGLAAHPELGTATTTVLVDALRSEEPGVVAVAAKAVADHPERTAASGALTDAVTHALANAWPAADLETRANLLDAAAALRLASGKEAALASCAEPTPVLRAHAKKLLEALGLDASGCVRSADPPLAPELAAAPSAATASVDDGAPRGVRLVFVTDAGELTVHLDAREAPVTAAHFARLARNGVYKGTAIHRVVTGFVAQLGDPEGDGYGGAGETLRCETSPISFAPFDVGVPLSGRDTGASQLFVTLARTPHLDGAYAWVGHADGDWAAVVEGDVIQDVRVEAE